MIQLIWRLAKRFAVLIPGLIIAYFSARKIFPYFDKRLPLALAVFLTYVIVAYVLVPAFIRLWRILKPADHLPLYCVTPDGFASDPLNIGIVGTRRELIMAMEKAGWHLADPKNIKTGVRQMLNIVYGWNYPNAPVSSLYLFGRKQDLAFEIPLSDSSRHSGRHHVRFWATSYDPKKPLDSKIMAWQNRNAHVQKDNLFWVGAASLDVGIGYIRHNFQLTHEVDPDTNKERELIVKNLRGKGLVKNIERVKVGEPYKLINRVMRGSLHTDGKMAIVTLKTKRRS